jgi:hypothetical protein
MARILILGLVVMLAGCNSSDSTPPKDGTVNAGNEKGTSSSCSGGLCVSALPLNLVLEPFADEGHGLVGTICVKDASTKKTVTDATVTVNGVAVPHDTFLTDCWQPSTVAIPDLGPGKKISIAATKGAASGSIDLTCPAEVKITAPTEGSTVSVGQKITVSWDGKIKYDYVGGVGWALIDHYDAAASKGKAASAVVSESHVNLKETDTSVSLTIPSAEYSGFAVELGVFGDGTLVGNTVEALCALVRRVHLVKQ